MYVYQTRKKKFFEKGYKNILWYIFGVIGCQVDLVVGMNRTKPILFIHICLPDGIDCKYTKMSSVTFPYPLTFVYLQSTYSIYNFKLCVTNFYLHIFDFTYT